MSNAYRISNADRERGELYDPDFAAELDRLNPPRPLTIDFRGPNWVSVLKNADVRVYESKECASKDHATVLACRWAKRHGFVVVL